ncbi:MAG: hypothetical protein ACK47B_15130 [Armatimonadota bacterium]
MRPTNIRRLLLFRKDGAEVLPQEAARARYGFEPEGTNFYYGVNEDAAGYFARHGRALRPHHQRFFDALLASLRASEQPGKTLNLALLPYQLPDPYRRVERNLDLLHGLAAELEAYQQLARAAGKRLEIVIRYASEFNDSPTPSQVWGRRPDDYRRTFPMVREVFRFRAPEVRFAFSPAIRSDIRGDRYAMIRDYWPGDHYVDVVSCTWFVGRDRDFDGAVDSLRRYFREFRRPALALGIDEIGGIREDRENDAMLQRMFGVLQDLRGEGVELDSVTAFVEGKWGTDATLAFLR